MLANQIAPFLAIWVPQNRVFQIKMQIRQAKEADHQFHHRQGVLRIDILDSIYGMVLLGHGIEWTRPPPG